MTNSPSLRRQRMDRASRIFWHPGMWIALAVFLGSGSLEAATGETGPRTVLLGLGDSLTHGTLDGANNWINTLNAYLQRIANSLGQRIPLSFSQPLFSLEEKRLRPFILPTNLGVSGADAFSLEGIEYFQRAGVPESYVSPDLLADKLLPRQLQDTYDKVLYPINLYVGRPTSQLDSAIWLLNHGATAVGIDKAVVIFWVGNNDSGTAALGSGGMNPMFFPLPLDQIEPVMPLLTLLLRFGESLGLVSFAPYTLASIERNLTRMGDFAAQYDRLLTRLQLEERLAGVQTDLFLLTLPYYSAVGYLFDSDDLEFYLRKVNPAYGVPPSFKRVVLEGPGADPLSGDRVSLLTFGLMYALLDTGFPVEYVNQILEVNGQQRDELVLSESEQQYIMARIDWFNAVIKLSAAFRGPRVHLVDIGQFMNDALSGKLEVKIGDRVLSRKWIRGSSFSMDGVHPSYTGHALVANFVLAALNQALGLDAPLEDLSAVLAGDPYVDRDRDGWAPGPPYTGSGLTEVLFFFKDPDDRDPSVQPVLPADVWVRIQNALLEEIFGIPVMREEALRMGLAPAETAAPEE